MEFPSRKEYNDYFSNYIKLLPQANPVYLLEQTHSYQQELLKRLEPYIYDYRYDIDKWSVKELLIHLMDCEQILAYRALRFARNDFSDPLLFDEDNYVSSANASSFDWDALLEQLDLTRRLSIKLFKNFDASTTLNGGSKNFPLTVRAIAATISGHGLHHLYVLQERYLKVDVKRFFL